MVMSDQELLEELRRARRLRSLARETGGNETPDVWDAYVSEVEGEIALRLEEAGLV